jgi:hypothetical protein
MHSTTIKGNQMILIPKFRNTIELGGTLALAHFRDGELIDTRFQSNLVTVVGKQWIGQRMKDASIPAQMSHMALGGSLTPGALAITSIADTDTTLTTTGAYAQRGIIGLTTAGGTGAGATITYNATFPTTQAANSAIVEAAIYNTSGTPGSTVATCMLCKTNFQVVNKGANDTIAITWTVTIQ